MFLVIFVLPMCTLDSGSCFAPLMGIKYSSFICLNASLPLPGHDLKWPHGCFFRCGSPSHMQFSFCLLALLFHFCSQLPHLSWASIKSASCWECMPSSISGYAEVHSLGWDRGSNDNTLSNPTLSSRKRKELG